MQQQIIHLAFLFLLIFSFDRVYYFTARCHYLSSFFFKLWMLLKCTWAVRLTKMSLPEPLTGTGENTKMRIYLRKNTKK